jgi:hypothetical protein
MPIMKAMKYAEKYVLSKYPDAHAECMLEAARWVITAKAPLLNQTIGTGVTKRSAWHSAYKFVQHEQAVIEESAVSTPKISTELPWEPNTAYKAGDTVLFPDGYKRAVIMGGTSGSTLPSLSTTNSSVDGMSDSGTVRFGAPQSTPVPMAQQGASTIQVKFKVDTNTESWHPGEIIPIDVIKKNPILFVKPEEDFEPVTTTPIGYAYSVKRKASLTDQSLVQHIGVASNCNVIIQEAFSIRGVFGRKIRLVCKKCNKDKVYLDESVFHMTPDGIVKELKEFCYEHRHDGGKAEMPWKTVAVPDPKKLVNFRRFRED